MDWNGKLKFSNMRMERFAIKIAKDVGTFGFSLS